MGGASENGQKFGKYHLIEKIAVGGMAELYRAKLYGAGGFEKDLAIKKILPHLADDLEFTKMFLDEAMITVTLNHGNIVSVIDFGEVDGQYFLVMEFVDGVDLQMLLQAARERNEPLPPQLACYIALEVCRGLDYAHRKQGADGKPLQIVHRDISPQNIMLSFEGEVKIADFGIARAASRVSSTQAGMVKGKLAYMSPEQISGGEVDRRTDIYAVGVMLYEMLTNQRPFEGSTPQETLAAITTGSPKKPHKINRKVDRRLSSIVLKALERSPRKRYQTAGELAADLSSFLHKAGLYPEPAELAKYVRELLPDARPRIGPPTPPAPAENRGGHEPMVTDVMGTTSQDVPAAGSDSHPLREAVSFEDLGLDFGFGGPIEPPDSTRPTDPVRPAVKMEQLRASTIIQQPDLGTGGGGETLQGGRTKAQPAAEQANASAAAVVQERSVEKEPSGTSVDADGSPDIHSARTLLFRDETAEGGEETREAAEQVVAGEAVHSEPEAPAAGEPEPKAEPAGQEPATQAGAAASASEDDDQDELARQWLSEAPVQAAAEGKKVPRHLIALGGFAAVAAAVAIAIALLPSGKNETEPPAAPAVENEARGAKKEAGEARAKPSFQKPAAVEPEASQPAKEAGKGATIPAAVTGTENTEEKKTPGVLNERSPAAPQGKGDEAVASGKDVAVPPKKASGQAGKKVAKSSSPRKEVTKRAERPSYRKHPRRSGWGTLKLNSEPFAIVYWKGKKLGPTPLLGVKLPVGSHTLVLRNPALGIVKNIRVKIEKGKEHKMFIDLSGKD